MLGKNFAIDIGSNSIKVFEEKKGIIYSQATAICYDAKTNEIVSIGNHAFSMIDKHPDSLTLIMPIVHGEIYNFKALTDILSYLLSVISKNQIVKPNLIISLPGNSTEIQKKAIIDICCTNGAKDVRITSCTVASAFGTVYSADKPKGLMVVDIGAGTTDLAGITMGSVHTSSLIKLGGNDIDQSIMQFVRFEKKVIISSVTASKLKCAIASASNMDEEVEISFIGKDVVTNVPKICYVTNKQLYIAIKPIIKQILQETKNTMELLPAQMFMDICEHGIILCGGVSKLKNIDKAFEEYFSIPVRISLDAEYAAIKGLGNMHKNLKYFEDRGYIFKLKNSRSFYYIESKVN